ncbi:hypothetical protein MJ1_0313 [Nanobdella aerobiophila]|uniref:Uncharacterized protein n=1 Tax=Nanobdella aerobiophila TaxID=2586965 RepID=A0A915SF52_9ARCH|nr:hypothetical protein [Nanobdella aerobiophila]BBL45480.1 hypothetical protein MJ1_0313 [Nanobdella aerobiophila]
MEIEIEILRPVNPTGRSFIRNFYGAISAKDKDIINKYKKEFTKLLQRFGFKIEESIGQNKLITGTIVLVIDDNTKEPKSIYSKKLRIWDITKEYDNKIELNL